ncbi:MAG: rhomboid family intramembrane serine protease [Myxococcota bacterium]
MIPLRDDIRSRTVPFVNYAMIGLCTIGFGAELAVGSGPGIDRLIEQHGLIPARFLTLGDRFSFLYPALYAPFLTSIFLHGGYLHFILNMLFLWIFGDDIEDRMGHLGYACFFLAGGGFAGAAHVAANPASVVPTIGASGAIAAVMGAYLLLYPRARIESIVIFGFFVRLVSVPAFVYLIVWLGLQLIQGSLALDRSADPTGGVAWWAHAGGFFFGAGLVSILGLRAPAGRAA